MGNCQAIDAAALVIQHPDGRIERLYWPVTASEVMRTNPGHYVSLIIPLPSPPAFEEDNGDPKAVRFTRVKLLRPSETLALGHAYRLITSQGIVAVLLLLFLKSFYEEDRLAIREHQNDVLISFFPSPHNNFMESSMREQLLNFS